MTPVPADTGVAVVTGGNRGLGLEACRQLATQSHRVVLTARHPSQGRTAAGALRGHQLDVTFAPLDVTRSDSISEFTEILRRDFRGVDVLVNNAGGALNGFNSDVVRRTLAVNVTGALNVTDAVGDLLSDTGRVVMVSSGMGQVGCLAKALRNEFLDPEISRERLADLLGSFARAVANGNHVSEGWPSSAYRVSKAALNACTRILAREFEKTGVLVNSVCPGWVRTDMGGSGATRSVEKGAAGIIWAATLARNGPTGGFFRDGQPISW